MENGKMPLPELSDSSCFHKTGLLWVWQERRIYKEGLGGGNERSKERKEEGGLNQLI